MEQREQVEQIRLEFLDIHQVLDERSLRWWCASKARAYNRLHIKGGVSMVHEATGVSRSRIYRGIEEMEADCISTNRIRKEGGGRKKNNGDPT